MRMDYSLIGKRIRKMREERGLTQADLAEKIEKSCPYMSQLETGKRNVTLELLTEIACALETTMEYLVVGTETVSDDWFDVGVVELFSDCSRYERRVLLEALVSLKNVLRANHKYWG